MVFYSLNGRKWAKLIHLGRLNPMSASGPNRTSSVSQFSIKFIVMRVNCLSGQSTLGLQGFDRTQGWSVRFSEAALAVAVCGLVACQPSTASLVQDKDNQLAGTASVIDGDTIEIHGERIRLDGYDSPERGSRCGPVNVYKEAAFALSDFIGRDTVTCNISGSDRYGRKIGKCEAGGKSLAEFMVSEGWARDWPRYSHGAYADEERHARNAHRGIWGLDCPDHLWGDRNYD